MPLIIIQTVNLGSPSQSTAQHRNGQFADITSSKTMKIILINKAFSTQRTTDSGHGGMCYESLPGTVGKEAEEI